MLDDMSWVDAKLQAELAAVLEGRSIEHPAFIEGSSKHGGVAGSGFGLSQGPPRR